VCAWCIARLGAERAEAILAPWLDGANEGRAMPREDDAPSLDEHGRLSALDRSAIHRRATRSARTRMRAMLEAARS
jgi:hypothetical protein